MVTDIGPAAQEDVGSRLRRRAAGIRSWLCLGLDPVLDRLPARVPRSPDGVELFCSEIIDACHDSALCFKLNFGFYEALGPAGWRVLERIRARIPPDIPVIADAKKGDVSSTATGYARGLFDILDFDAVTLSPYMGWDSLQPWEAYGGRLLLVLCKTSNPGARDFQDLLVDGEPLYLRLARQALQLHGPAEVGLVVGATYPQSLARVRALDQRAIILCPGIGAQGGDPAEAVRLGGNAKGENLLAAVSRDILYASNGPHFADVAARAAARFAGSTFSSRI